MKLFRKVLSFFVMAVMVMSLSACGNSSTSKKEESSKADDSTKDLLKDYKQDDKSLTFDNNAWNYDKDNNVYYKIGIGYCLKPETTDYETMAIYVPGEYMNATSNGDGTYKCTINTSATINGYTAETAPIVFPVNTAGYSAQAAAKSYSYNGLSSYMKAGFIYVYAGLRGRDNGYDSNGKLTYSGGAPWGVTDLKSAVRYYRYNKGSLPGNTDRIFTFGHSGGGAQSALMGASGDSKLYYNYLTSIGSAMYDKDGKYISDAIDGAMSWCPITSLDYADEAYEWNMGQYASTGTRANNTWTSSLSKDLAESYATYINKLGLKDKNGTALTLEKSNNGIYASGTYYDYMISVIETSLNNFLSDTTFPYTKSSGMTMGDGGFAGGGAPGGDAPGGDMPAGSAPNSAGGSSSEASSKSYNTAQDYINSLNSDEKWVEYNAGTNTVKITSIEAFVKHCKNASKDVGAFDDLNRKQAENNVFGNDDNDSLHFDAVMAGLLEKNKDTYSKYSDWNSSVVDSYANDLKAVDKFGKDISYRQNMYNPMYYLTNYYDGYKTSKVATHWRIHTGIAQGDTASTVEANLALALQSYDGVKDVNFETVWDQGHTTAERTGNSTDNFIKWVNECSNQ